MYLFIIKMQHRYIVYIYIYYNKIYTLMTNINK